MPKKWTKSRQAQIRLVSEILSHHPLLTAAEDIRNKRQHLYWSCVAAVGFQGQDAHHGFTGGDPFTSTILWWHSPRLTAACRTYWFTRRTRASCSAAASSMPRKGHHPQESRHNDWQSPVVERWSVMVATSSKPLGFFGYPFALILSCPAYPLSRRSNLARRYPPPPLRLLLCSALSKRLHQCS